MSHVHWRAENTGNVKRWVTSHIACNNHFTIIYQQLCVTYHVSRTVCHADIKRNVKVSLRADLVGSTPTMCGHVTHMSYEYVSAHIVCSTQCLSMSVDVTQCLSMSVGHVLVHTLCAAHNVCMSHYVCTTCLTRGGGLGSRPKKMYGKRLGDGVEYHLMSPTPRR